jgi:ABC-type branched-subunit amino acid transport system substrate-binding protein
MRQNRPQRRTAAIVAVVAMLAASCASGGGTDAGPTAAPGGIVYDKGVTAEPCPDAVNPDNGCIYLGVLSDLSEGPFAALAVPIVEGQRGFWAEVNAAGGIGGFDIDIDTYTRDTKYNTQEHSAAYRQIEPNILAIAQTLGTPTTLAILRDMDQDDVIGSPASWWSGWHFEDSDRGLILESGYSYCLEAMVGLDWYAQNQTAPSSVLAVGYPGDYGGDSAQGVEEWATATGTTFAGKVETAPNATIGTQDAAVSRILSSGADLVFLAAGPAETAEIVGKAAAGGYQGKFMGAVPTWNPALSSSPAGPALEALFTHVSPWENFGGTSVAHDKMRASLGGELPANDGYTFGWIWSYPMKAALEAAVENGDLSRQGLRSVVDGLVVDYEGALPTSTFGGAPGENIARTATISVPDPEGLLGIRTVASAVSGRTADAFSYVGACSG